ncbi:MAG TPA: GNAT family N-acetyltransferase [Candidatus Elarobacter sp.]|nr:GNAT family N-acetyltransferase [Candidatus Elarobacter sp.]
MTRATRRDAIGYAARRPYDNAFLQWVLEGGHGPGASDELILNRDYRGRINGLVYFGAQLVLAADDPSAIDAFAVETRKHRGLRSFVGPKEIVDELWGRVKSWHPAPEIVREMQPVYALNPRALREAGPDVDVRRARADEAELVAEHSGAMILAELGYDPRANRAGFLGAVRRAIAHGVWWVWVVDGTLRFQLNVGPRTAATAQLQGVWTPPEQRGNGYASLALAAIARRLFTTETSLSLYVNDFNAPAIALYERLGFNRVGTFATYLFP